ncbi:DUF736 domain-containing protein [Blastochloris sulfoviridis]|uniref:DUF736 domain-containing protein n=1 Tax=Blastochloris sulfoviridis TaxID=50712 RepID=A0A5M6I1R3_9HYPH|nr:DUF736 domain-containing protein [Blastochloris sulfoviridis]KAA5601765.1 DUF736 domain-containing protein [Blastochloris sulfoviridis]
MAHIGSFKRTSDGYSGRLRTLSLDVELTLVPVDKTNGTTAAAPDYRIHVGTDGNGAEVGAGWHRTSDKAGAYVSVVIDDPAFTQPIRANLFQADAEGLSFHLVWTRPSRHDDRT